MKTAKKKETDDGLVHFNDLPDGQYFRWKDKVYRKFPRGVALKLDDDSILDFGFHNLCEPIERPKSPRSLIIQYLDWALIQAHKDIYGDEYDQVTVVLDLKRMQSTTSWQKPKK